jgi:hypothetical protein
MRRKQATVLQVLISVLFAILVQLAVLFALRDTVNQLSRLSFSTIAPLELLVVWQLAVKLVPSLLWS